MLICSNGVLWNHCHIFTLGAIMPFPYVLCFHSSILTLGGIMSSPLTHQGQHVFLTYIRNIMLSSLAHFTYYGCILGPCLIIPASCLVIDTCPIILIPCIAIAYCLSFMCYFLSRVYVPQFQLPAIIQIFHRHQDWLFFLHLCVPILLKSTLGGIWHKYFRPMRVASPLYLSCSERSIIIHQYHSYLMCSHNVLIAIHPRMIVCFHAYMIR